jgi:hypothetical protein
MGHLISNKKYIQTWLAEEQGTQSDNGWVAVFNRTSDKADTFVSVKSLGLDPDKDYELTDIWKDSVFKPGKVELEPHGCVFIRYERKL